MVGYSIFLYCCKKLSTSNNKLYFTIKGWLASLPFWGLCFGGSPENEEPEYTVDICKLLLNDVLWIGTMSKVCNI